MDLEGLYSQVIRDHNLSRHNLRPLADPTVSVPGRNPSCGDEIELSLRLAGGRIADAAFSGVGCAISQASVSIMIDLIRGKTPEEAMALARLFLSMIRHEPLTEAGQETLDEAMALSNVANLPARVKCATMPWHTLIEALERLEAPPA